MAKISNASVHQEMAKPRLTLSVRRYYERYPMAADPKFCDGVVVHNHTTKEDGKIIRTYLENGVRMYRVLVPAHENSWERGTYDSDWEESRLELS
jgi:hypothetical protein